MQSVACFWNNTTNQVAFGDQLQDQRWNWDIGKNYCQLQLYLG